MKDDLYVLLVDWQPISSEGATFKIYVNPLVNWLWLGSLLFMIGIVIAVLYFLAAPLINKLRHGVK